MLSGVSNEYKANEALAIDETLVDGYKFVSISGNAKCPTNLGETITLAPGDDITCTITNDDIAGGEPRTIGFWSNWNTCTGGNQDQTAAENGGPEAGWYILDDLLKSPGYVIGILELGEDDCKVAVYILNKSDIEAGKKKASDAAYNLAAQLLAAELNLSAGAKTCQAVVDAVNEAQTLLAGIEFDGTGNYLDPKSVKKSKLLQERAQRANELAFILDTYNNGNLCTP